MSLEQAALYRKRFFKSYHGLDVAREPVPHP
jgi:hypothetical protein